jgi:hypothetical protein
MPTATPTVVLGKVLAAGIILTPLVVMLFPELNHRSGSKAAGGTQAAMAARAVVGGDSGRRLSDPRLVPCAAQRSDR